MPRENMNPEETRKQTIIALFSDDYLFERLVLKGGNAIHIAHKLALRSSLDLDFSLAGDFEDLEIARAMVYMVNASGGKFDAPKAPAPAADGSAAAPDATATAAAPAAAASK